MKKEIWKSIKEYEDMYEVSTFGNVRSLDRFIIDKRGVKRFCKGILLTQNTDGYYNHVALAKDGRSVTCRTHILVYDTFIGKKRSGMHIDHIDENKLNNNVDNLQLLDVRANASKSKTPKSGLTGAYKDGRKWFSSIYVNGKHIYLGSFNCPTAAHMAYLKKLKNIKDEQRGD